jgi:predicted nucleic acid-binding protein
VFIDTSGLIALVNTDDQWHNKAEAVWAELTRTNVRMYLTSLVLIELADGLSRVHHRNLAVQMVDGLQSSQRVEIIQVDERLELLGWKMFRDRMDKNWGMTDCLSFALMRERGIQNAFTADHHFEQAGFTILLT